MTTPTRLWLLQRAAHIAEIVANAQEPTQSISLRTLSELGRDYLDLEAAMTVLPGPGYGAVHQVVGDAPAPRRAVNLWEHHCNACKLAYDHGFFDLIKRGTS